MSIWGTAKKKSKKIKHDLAKKPWYHKQFHQAVDLLGRLFRLKLVRVVLVVLFLILVTPFVVFFLLRPKTPDQFNFGITFSNRYAEELGLDWKDTYLRILDELKVKNLRLVAYWDEAEPEQDQYDFSTIKWQLDEARSRGVNVILVTGRKELRWPECFEPQWWENIDNTTTQEEELYEFIKQTILELKGYENISMWQVENEPFWPFGDCAGEIKWEVLNREIEIARSLDDRPILVQDSGEGGVWLPTYLAGDYLAISMYRRIWYDFWGLILGRHVYFQYPLAHWTYKIKAELVQVPPEKIIVTELQAEPWGPGNNSILTREQKNQTMSRAQFIDTINYAQKTGFSDLYFWGAEWWLFEKEVKDEPFYWDTAKALFSEPSTQ